MPPPESEVPKRIGRYDIERVLGEGAMGVVYEGNDTRLHRKVAIKTILKSALDSDSAKEYSMRFAREAQAVARLNHANIVQVFDYAEEGEVAYIVMEFVKGKELKNFFDARERFELKEVVHIMGELCDALHFAHEAGIIHRDIKPANVMIDSQGRVKLTDFGVARITDAERKQSEKTQAGTVVGTPAYMSPEQIQSGNLDRRTDVFSAGVILYEFLTGEKPFTGSGAWTIAKKILQEEPKRPSQINNTLSPLFDAVVEKALCKNPEGRYRSARDFGMALKRALEGLPETDEVERTVKMPALHMQGGQIVPVGPVGDPTVLRTAPASAGANEIEIEFWRSIKDGKDPEFFDVYLQRFPEGIYTALAKRKAALLRSGAAADPKATQSIDMEREIAEAARRESEAKAKLAEEKAEMEANLARREAEFQKREAEAQAKLAEEKARHEAEVAKREADFRKQEAGRRKALVRVLAAAVIAVIGGALWYALKPPDPLAQRVAELTQMLEESKKREAALLQSRQREAELMKELELARQREAEALKSGDVARQREFAEQIRQREAEAKKQAELTRQREAEAKRQAEIAEQRRAEIAKLQGRPVKKAEPARPAEEARPEPVAPVPAPEPAKAAEPAKPAAEARPAGTKAPEAKAADSRTSEPLKMAAVTAVPPAGVPAPEPGAVSPEGQLQRAVALEGEGRNAEAVRLLRQVARGKGRTAGLAAKRLGDLMQKKGVPGVSYDYAEALKYYQIARDNGIELDVAKGR